MSAILKVDTAVDDLRYYLRAWRSWTRAWRAPLGLPSSVAWLRIMPPTPAWSCEDTDPEVDGFILRTLNAVIESLPANKRAAVRITYLNETLPASFRSGRMSHDELRRLCSEAAVEMIPKLRVRGVLLGGS